MNCQIIIFGKGWEASNSHITFDALLTSITHLNKEMFEMPLTRKVLFEKFNKKSIWFYGFMNQNF